MNLVLDIGKFKRTAKSKADDSPLLARAFTRSSALGVGNRPNNVNEVFSVRFSFVYF